MTTIVYCSIIVVVFLLFWTYIISNIKEKNIESTTLPTITETQESEFINFLKNNINEKNRYKIRNNIHE